MLIFSGSSRIVADLLARIERAVGVLEDDLHLAAQFRRQAVLGDVDLLPVDQHFARRGSDSIMVTSRARVDLPQPVSPTTASVLPDEG